MSKILLVEPNFPYPTKSKNRASDIHKNFVPIGLLKIGAYYKNIGNEVVLVRGKVLPHPAPQLILITSLFTYWSEYVWDSVEYYRNNYPKADIYIGGIYVTLHANEKYFIDLVKKYSVHVHLGLFKEAEKYYPDYSLLETPVDYHATHAMRGCIRKCSFCGTWKLEKRSDKDPDEIIEEIKAIGKNKVILFDNNFLANKNIDSILDKLCKLRINGRRVSYESQSGFDGRIIMANNNMAMLLKKANFQNVRIAWDGSYKEKDSIEKQINILVKAGYKKKDLTIFMIYNYEISFNEMVNKLKACKKWGVQISDCRYRPLFIRYDHYKPFKKGQTNKDYYIHIESGWSDELVKQFRKEVREHNIWIRYAKDKGQAYSKDYEKWSAIHNTYKYFNLGRPPQLENLNESHEIIERIKKLNKLKNYLKQYNSGTYDLSNCNGKLDEIIDKLLYEIDCKKGIDNECPRILPVFRKSYSK